MEEKKFKRTTVTAALPYANGGVHIGHLAGVYVPADIYVRYLRLKNQDVMFIGGSDEHGVPVTIRARKEGITVQEVVDRYHNLIKKSFEEFGISFDIYSRTTSKVHNKFASDFFRTLYDKHELVEKTEEQFCDEVTGEFLTDRNIVGTCPRCGAEGIVAKRTKFSKETYRGEISDDGLMKLIIDTVKESPTINRKQLKDLGLI